MSALCQKQTFSACSDHRSRNQALRFTILPRGAAHRGEIAKLPIDLHQSQAARCAVS